MTGDGRGGSHLLLNRATARAGLRREAPQSSTRKGGHHRLRPTSCIGNTAGRTPQLTHSMGTPGQHQPSHRARPRASLFLRAPGTPGSFGRAGLSCSPQSPPGCGAMGLWTAVCADVPTRSSCLPPCAELRHPSMSPPPGPPGHLSPAAHPACPLSAPPCDGRDALGRGHTRTPEHYVPGCFHSSQTQLSSRARLMAEGHPLSKSTKLCTVPQCTGAQHATRK